MMSRYNAFALVLSNYLDCWPKHFQIHAGPSALCAGEVMPLSTPTHGGLLYSPYGHPGSTPGSSQKLSSPLSCTTSSLLPLVPHPPLLSIQNCLPNFPVFSTIFSNCPFPFTSQSSCTPTYLKGSTSSIVPHKCSTCSFTPPPSPYSSRHDCSFTPPPSPYSSRRDCSFTPPPSPNSSRRDCSFTPPPSPYSSRRNCTLQKMIGCFNH